MLKCIFTCAAAALLIFSPGCSGREAAPAAVSSAAGTSSGGLSLSERAAAEPVSEAGEWIASVSPADGSFVDDSGSDVVIRFQQEMDESTLNAANIPVRSGKYDRDISDLFRYTYQEDTRTLTLAFRLAGNSYGTGDGVEIYLRSGVRNKSGREMGRDFRFGFST